MSFKDNILNKIRIDHLAQKVLDSIGLYESGIRIDKKTTRQLLKTGEYQYKKRRDLDWYIKQDDSGLEKILVLDNDLPIYKTTVEDVVLRKSPTVKEMISIRNAIKILNDKDVIISKKHASLKTVQKECIATLDLSYDESVVTKIANEGAASFENGYIDGVLETLSIFYEILRYIPLPKPFSIGHHEIYGAESKKDTGQTFFGPVIIYSLMDNQLKLITEKMNSNDQDTIEVFNRIASGKEEPKIEGVTVFQYLKNEAVKLIPC